MKKMLISCCVFILAILPANAQTKSETEASLRVAVRDQNNAAVVRSRLTLTTSSGVEIQGETDPRGEAIFTNLLPGKYRLQISAAGFESRQIDDLTIRSGANRLDARLTVARVKEELTVEQDEREKRTDPRGPSFSRVLTEEQIAQLPDDPDELERVLTQMAGPGATIRINGFRGGKLPHKSQIRQIRFRLTPYSAEDHDEGFTIIDIITKPALGPWFGMFNFGFRDEALNARNPAAPFRAAEQLRRFAFSLGGPLKRERTSLSLWASSSDSYEAKTIVAALPDGTFSTIARTPARSLNLSARLEHALSKTQTLYAEYQRTGQRQDNLGVGNFDLAERAYTSRQTENRLRVSESGTLGQKLFSQLRMQASWRSIDSRSVSDAPAIIVLNAFSRGGAGIVNDRSTREFEMSENLDFAHRHHSFRTGVLFETANYDSTELRNGNGTFTFASLDAFREGRPTTYTRRRGEANIELTQNQFGWYLQDDWRAHKSLSLSYGLRHEWQNDLADRNNFAPRFGLAWSPFKNGQTTVRAGAGIFYSWFGADLREQLLRVNGQQQREIVILNPNYPDPFGANTETIELPPSRLARADDLRMPYYTRASVGVERQWLGKFMSFVDYRFQRGTHLLRSRNINAPLVDGRRPRPEEGNITQLEATANFWLHQINVGIGPAPAMSLKRIFWFLNYTAARSTNEADSAFSLPVDNYDLRAERGPASDDVRHRFSAMANVTLMKRTHWGLFFNYSSATPYNLTTGFDDNQDSSINDRPIGVGRNSARGAAQWDLSSRLGWSWAFGERGAAGMGGGAPQTIALGTAAAPASGGGAVIGFGAMRPEDLKKRYRLEFYLQANNLLNHANPINFSGVLTSPFYGRATAAMPGRRLETGLNFSF
jgi:hypothetical protein